MFARSAAFVLLSVCIPAQDLPKLLRLGPVPMQPTLTVDSGVAPDLTTLPAGLREVVLRVAATVPAGAVDALLHTLRDRGVATVHFAASLPDGTAGVVSVALPEAATVPTTLVLRAHRGRPGVPASSAILPLQRLRAGWEHEGRGFVLALDAPANEPWQHVLPLLGAAAEAGVSQLCLRTTAADASPAPRSLALDLEGAVTAWIPATEPRATQPGVATTPFGCLQRAPVTAATLRPGGAGGRFGGRHAQEDAAAPQREWTGRQQRADGAMPPDGEPDREGMALWCLACLADGTTLDAGIHRDSLRRCIGWLVANQDDDGSFEDLSPGSVQRQAQITYALAEACGLSPSGDLLRQAAMDALQWLFARREQDGGWSPIPGTPSHAAVTAWALTANASASFFGLRGPMPPGSGVEWFDTHGSDEPLPAAAELFSRFFAGQDPKDTPRMTALADSLLARADPQDPHTAFWTTHALFQQGGRHWVQWSKRLHAAIAKTQLRDGDLNGSWAPAPGCSRLVTTALHILSLQAYYRYTRLVR